MGSVQVDLAVLVFSYNLEKVVLVRKSGCYAWTFPSRPKIGNTSVPELAQAGLIAEQVTGLAIAKHMSGEYIELMEQSSQEVMHTTHAYVAVDVGECELTCSDSEIEEVAWKPFQALLYQPHESVQLQLPYGQHIDRLLNFVDRHPELRMEPDLELIQHVTWHKDTWTGIAPKEFLQKWCEDHQCAEACYNVIEQRPASNGSGVTFCGVCVLPHLGVQVAAERSFHTIDEAVQNAALLALLYLDGAVPDGSTRMCHVIPVGYQIPLKCTFIEPAVLKSEAQMALKQQSQAVQKQKDYLNRQFQKQTQNLEQQMKQLKRQQQALIEGGVAAHQVLQAMTISAGPFAQRKHYMGNRFRGGGREYGNPRPLKRQRNNNNSTGNTNASAMFKQDNKKNAIMLVKEYCDKMGWQQPMYQFEQGDGEYQGLVSLPPANIQNLRGPKGISQKSAKTLVAEIVWTKLQQMAVQNVGMS
eukprot:TRINITY_DN12187_c0_g2_i11.p1 TRINITY_DN12187_c0_g2~~TRINITY_DN12187_c0_g2_i11.p1  ORF type:complete len:470 (+),score=59.51 TRINITY_DN12187_c0_g2_i11:40-1449(+)